MRHTLLLLLFALLLAPSAAAQPPLNGTVWTVTNLDGSPVVPGATIEVAIYSTPTGQLQGDVTIDRGEGPVPLPGEQMTITEVAPGFWEWINAKGNSGDIIWDYTLNAWVSTVTTGPNAGTQRMLTS